MSTVREDLAFWIRAYRGGHQMTQWDLGEAVGLDSTAISKIESTERGTKAEELMRIAEAFGIEHADLMKPAPRRAPSGRE